MTLWRRPRSFAHGVHLPESKQRTEHLPIRQFPFAPLLIVPLLQHLGKPAIAVVKPGQEVARGQLIGRPDGDLSVAVHAPVSGVVRSVHLAPSLSGHRTQAVFLEPFPASTQEVYEGKPCDIDRASRNEILEAIQWAGIVGLGGAAFPTHKKLEVPEGKWIDTLILNGAECEPYLTTDHRVMLEQAEDIAVGIRYLLRVTGAQTVWIGIEENKLDAVRQLEQRLPKELPVRIEPLAIKYPQGAEKMLIRALLGREVPSKGLPVDVHVLCINVATAAEMGRLLPHGRGIQERVVTVSGPAVKDAGNYRIPIGTPLRFVLEVVGVTEDFESVFLGGPMMGTCAPNLDIPVVKGTSGIIAWGATETALGSRPKERPCIRCAACLEACPLSLNPSWLGLLAKNGEYERMERDHHLMDCFECGSCNYVCPSHIPLVQHFRVAKAAVRRRRALGEAS